MSVRDRKWITTKGEERAAWVLDYRDKNGKRRIQTFERKKEAVAKQHEVAIELKDGTHVPSNESITVAHAGENWIKEGEKNNRERATLFQYRGLLDNHISPYLGKVKLADLTGPRVSAYDRAMHEKKTSEAMRRKALVALSSILRLAVKDGYVNRNVAEGHHVKADKRSKRKLKIGADIPSLEEMRAFLAVLDEGPERWRPFFLTAVFTGMRASELRGLHWNNVDLKRGEIHVVERADVYNDIGHPKSEAGERTIPIGPKVVNALKHRKTCLRSRKKRPTSGAKWTAAGAARRCALANGRTLEGRAFERDVSGSYPLRMTTATQCHPNR